MTDTPRDIDRSETHVGCRENRAQARAEGVTDPGNLPFLLMPEQSRAAVLLVHGFTGTPWEMRLLAEHLAAQGLASYAVRLPGHGTSAEDLAGRRLEEWQATVAAGQELLEREFRTVFGAGMSTGCLLLLDRAVTHPFDGLAFFSPYLRVRHRLAPYAGWLKWILPYHDKGGPPETGNRYYARRPVAGVHQINRLIRKVRTGLPAVRCPVLAYNGEGDETVDIGSVHALMERLGSTFRIHETFGPEVPHVLTREENPHRESMFAQAAAFFQTLAGLPCSWRQR